MGRLTALLIASLFLVGCADRGPEDAVRALLGTLEASRVRSPSAAEITAAYEMLDTSARAALDARAARASAALGVEISPSEVLRYHGLAQGNRVSGVEIIEADAERAVAEVRFAWVVPSDVGGPGVAPEPMRLPIVLEDGAWRVALPISAEVGP